MHRARRKGQKRIEAEQRQARSRKRQEIQKRITALEKEIAELETREKELTAELEKPETYATGGRATQINRELMEVHDRLAGGEHGMGKGGDGTGAIRGGSRFRRADFHDALNFFGKDFCGSPSSPFRKFGCP